MILLLSLLSLAWPQSQLTVVLEDFSSSLRTGQNGLLPQVYNTEDPGQSASIVNGAWQVTGSTTAGLYWYWLMGPNYDWASPCNNYLTCGYMQAAIKSGTWDANFNRLGMRFKCTGNAGRRTDGGGVFELGTYIRDKNGVTHNNAEEGGNHYYHIFDFSVYANEWMWMEISRHPQHQRSASVSLNWPDNPESALGSYFDTMTNFYWDTQGPGSGSFSNQVCTFDDIGLWKDTGKAPEEYVSSVAVTYNGSAYEVTWATVKNQSPSYQVRHSSTSLRSAGWSTGTDDGTATGPGNDYAGAIKTITMARSSGTMYFAIRPLMNVASVSGTSPITINTGVGHSLVTGDQVSISGVCANANGTRTATVVDRDTITIGVSGACSYTSGGTVQTTSETEGFYQIQFDPTASSSVGRRVSGSSRLSGKINY